MKQVLNNIDLNVVVSELREEIIGKHVKNVYQIDDSKFIVSYRNDGNKQLLIEPPSKIYITQYSYDKPKNPPPFCMSLRKYLRNRRILDFYQASHLDRILIMVVQGPDDEQWRLYMEFFGKGNIVLLKPDNTVLVARRYMRQKSEVILPNKPFTFPQPTFQDLFEVDASTLSSMLAAAEGTASKVLSGNFNINVLYADEICARAGIPHETPASQLSDEQVELILDAIKAFNADLSSRNLAPCIVSKDTSFEAPESVEPFDFAKYQGLEKRAYPTFNQALDEYFSRDLKKEEGPKGEEKKKFSKNERIMIAQIEQVSNLESTAAEMEKTGNLLYQYFLPASKLLETVRSARKQGLPWDEIVARIETGKQQGIEEALIFDSPDPGQPYIYIRLEDTIIPLDLRYTLTDNINMYFYDKSKKSKRKMPGAKETIERMRKLVAEEKEREIEAEKEQTLAFKVKKRKKEWFEKFHWFFSSDGYLVIGGRDASSNETVFGKYLKPNDLFFHSELPGAPVVVIKNLPDAAIESIPESTIREAATFGSSYSRSWKENLNAADIYSALPDQVSKTPQSGEFLPKGSFVIRGERTYYRNIKLNLAVGFKLVAGHVDRDALLKGIDLEEIKQRIQNEDVTPEFMNSVYPVIIGGPLAPIMDQAMFFVKIKPSKDGLNPGNLASKLKALFTQKLVEQLETNPFVIDIEEVQAWLPTGKSIIEKD
jgi:predicted ribosome quality control (RQC) complex YloA/Tae2 family protein